MPDKPSETRPGLLEQDNYGVAVRAAVERIRSADLGLQAARAGATPGVDGLRLRYFGADVLASADTGQVSRASDGETLPVWEQILVLHYLLGAADGLAEDADHWVAFRELPEAAFYDSAFRQQVASPLAQRFGEQPARLQALEGRWDTTRGEQGDASLVFTPFPYVRLAVQVWAGDEDFPAEAGVLFSRSTGRCLTAEDAAVLADVALRLILGASGE